MSTPHNDATEVAAFDADVEATKQGLEAEQAAQDRETDEAIAADVAAAAGDDAVPADDAVSADDADVSAEPEDPVAEMKAALRRAPGDWYVIHSYAGYENKVKANLETRVQNLDVGDYIFQVEVPTEEVTEIKNGQRKQVNRKVLPGYILVRMELNDESWQNCFSSQQLAFWHCSCGQYVRGLVVYLLRSGTLSTPHTFAVATGYADACAQCSCSVQQSDCRQSATGQRGAEVLDV